MTLSVSELATAVACPRLLYLHRHGGGPTFLFETGRSFALGRLLHRWLAQLIRQARGRGALGRALRASGDAPTPGEVLRHHLYREAFFPWMAGQAHGRSPAEVVLLWDSLAEAASFLGDLLAAAGPAGPPPSHVLLGAELSLARRLRVDGGEVEVRGTVDALVRDPRDGRLTILDFKTRPDRNAHADLIQVAAYAWLLEGERGLRAGGALAYLTPRLEVSRFAPADLERAVGQHIPSAVRQIAGWLARDARGAAALPPAADPRLCGMCPHHPPCPQRFPLEALAGGAGRPSGEPLRGRPRPPARARGRPAPPALAAPRPGADPLQDRLVEVLAGFRCPVEPLGHQAGPTFVRYRLRPAPGVAVAAIRSRQEDLKVQLGLVATPLIEAGPGYVSVDVPRPERAFVGLADILDRPELAGGGGRLAIPLGVSVDGRLATADLADPDTCHFLVGGTPGSGKSEFLRAVLCALARRQPPQAVRVVLIDPKQVTFAPLAALPHVQGQVVSDPEDAVAAVEALGEEMARRYGRFREAGVAELSGYQAAGGSDLPRMVVLFDEFGECMLRHARMARALEGAVVRLGQMARAAGIHLILATQKPVVKVVTGLIKGNLPGRIAFRTASRADSQVILDRDDAAHLLGKGDLIAQWAGTTLRLQAPWVPPAVLQGLPGEAGEARKTSGGSPAGGRPAGGRREGR